MEDEETSAVKPTFEEMLSASAFEALHRTPTGANVSRCELELNDGMIPSEEDKIERQIKGAIFAAYFEYDLSKQDINEAVAEVIVTLRLIQDPSRDTMDPLDEPQQIAHAFRATYVGDADTEFREYLAACCSAYCAHTSDYKAPYVTITQSSGFGKSRILRELAESTAAALCQAFSYVMNNPSAGKEWTTLFDNESNGRTVDDVVVEKLNSVVAQPEAKKQRTSESTFLHSESGVTSPVLVLAIDEARALFDIKNTSGLRPRASDPLATRLVGNFRSILHYVTYKNDAHISSYSSDPILTFGASRLWYQLEPPALETHILPQFQAMLLNGVVDTGNIGEIATRIFLLLAMDATTMCADVSDNVAERKEFVFSGQFCEVPSFIAMLLGDDPGKNQFTKWLSGWGGWKICFSHFVDLPEQPTTEMLWKMLDRRAAGILPRNQKGADLVIPIFRKDLEPSLILVQVKNIAGADSGFLESALSRLEPRNVFKANHSLRGISRENMIRLYVSLREEQSAQKPAQSGVTPKAYSFKRRSGLKPYSYALCLRGMFRSSTDINDTQRRWPFMSIKLIEQLCLISNSAWWDASTHVEYDLDKRNADDFAKRPLSRVLTKEKAIQVSAKTMNLFSRA
ncbi:uncharacterized protein PITG_14792 [Phytophthora infestans T30-4]|uniref:Uncharacterized protein n=1 Tax=Phytophthora infestans (strain T30-4) TaxID=403677 RepID=D0NP23_PHYIT|nr:uncharacterized protein PITG_14792 [Phytophthora infestans T30-4]EEY62365.1 conserved hypothetical protein [Phytophthora infestans T30-4]|eukprot:XP_002899001.1 conserved hypothetical protein [Phytophthora infestans T30-4]